MPSGIAAFSDKSTPLTGSPFEQRENGNPVFFVRDGSCIRLKSKNKAAGCRQA